MTLQKTLSVARIIRQILDKQRVIPQLRRLNETATTLPNPPKRHTIPSDFFQQRHQSSAAAAAAAVADASRENGCEPLPASHVPPTPSIAPFSNSPPTTKYKPIPPITLRTLPKLYSELSKAKLGGLVALSTMCGYAIAPGAADLMVLLTTTLGTVLCICSANAINQWIEVPYDAQMLRTRNRVLVRRALTPFHVWSFGAVTGLAGVSLLATTVNPLTAFLGAANIVLYTGVYTPMKRTSIANTWVGALVGAVPPMMGWAASTGALDPGAWLLGGVLFAWQFPHFNSLSWNLRSDYSKAGYRMTSVTDPALNARVSLRYALAMLPLCWAMPAAGVTSWWFAVDSTFVNAAMAVQAWRFWRESNERTARQLFFGSVINLPLVLALMMVHKVGRRDGEETSRMAGVGHEGVVYVDEDDGEE